MSSYAGLFYAGPDKTERTERHGNGAQSLSGSLEQHGSATYPSTISEPPQLSQKEQQSNQRRGCASVGSMVGPAVSQDRTHTGFLRLCLLLNVLTLFAGVLSVLANIAIVSSDLSPPDQLQGCEVVVRCYGILFGLMVVLGELDWPPFLQLMPFLESWVIRGGCLIFLGNLLGLAPHVSEAPTLHGLRVAAAWLLICMGTLYATMGLLCFRLLRLRQASKLKSRKLMADEVLHLQGQKHEIERLLADTESKLQNL